MPGGIPIGWPGAGSEGSMRVQLARADTLVLYTDGLIEGTKDIVAGLEALSRFALETSTYPAGQQARVLVERALTGAARRDDSLALVLRRRQPPPDAGARPLSTFEHGLARSEASVSMARRLLKDWLRFVPVEEWAIDDLLLVCAELCSNAIRHATFDEEGVRLRAWTDGADVVVEVSDDGPGLALPRIEDAPPDPAAERGRGLWLVRELSDSLDAERVDGRSVVRSRKRSVAGNRHRS